MTIENQNSQRGNFTACAGLVTEQDLALVTGTLEKIREDGGDPLQFMLNLQMQAQQHLSNTLTYVPRPDKLETCGEILDWMKQQDDSIADETRELYTALGGMSNGEKPASAVFKPWKADHLMRRATKFSDLSESDRLEVAFELIDQWHFFMCKFLALGMDSETIFKLYALKQAENIRRWSNNY